MLRTFSLILLILFSIACTAVKADVVFGKARIKIGSLPEIFNVEFAYNDQQRAQGLMYRDTLCSDCGMLFDFDESRIVAMWMKNTRIALDVAYFTKDGTISDIKTMAPYSLQPHPSSTQVRYALEMPAGWFERNAISVGNNINIISAQKAR
mgnify:CR=1 FL=1|jgi:uncharacterized membrane protein (UPF0127 family)